MPRSEKQVIVSKTLEDMSWDELVDRLWCDIDNLTVLDKDCHKAKSKEENVERKILKKSKANASKLLITKRT